MMSLQGKIAVITGASSGIGAAIAEYFSKEGALLSLSGRRKENLESVANKCKNTDSVLITVGDLTERTTREMIVKRTIDKFSKMDILVNNAAIAHLSSVRDEKEGSYDEVMNVNLKVPFFLTQLLIPYLIESKGSVINISSLAGIKPGLLGSVYGMSKSGLDLFTRSLARGARLIEIQKHVFLFHKYNGRSDGEEIHRELAPEGVRVNTIAPGFIPETDILTKLNKDMNEIKELGDRFSTSVPLGRNGTPEEVAKAVAFLASDNAAFIAGQILCVDGGLIQVVPY